MEILKLQYMTLRNDNLPIYGAINVKELKNYVTDTCVLHTAMCVLLALGSRTWS